mgnify:CR=1 FL=1
MDPEEYLRSDFDASKLTVPKLRLILIDQDIKYPSSANKSKLVELFNDEVKPKAAQLLEQYKKASVANSSGIIFMYSPKQQNNGISDHKKSESNVPSKITTPKSPVDIKIIETEKKSEKDNVDRTFSSENVFQSGSRSKSPNLSPKRSPRRLHTKSPKKPLTATPRKGDKKALTTTPTKSGQVIPQKRSSPVADENEEQEGRKTVKKKILRRALRRANDSLNSDSSTSATASPHDKSALSFEKFENVNLDSLMDQFEKTPTGIESPSLKKISSGADILSHYKKSVPSGKVVKEQGSTKKHLQKKLETVTLEEQGKENENPKSSPIEENLSATESAGPIMYSPESIPASSSKDDVDVSVASIQSSNTFISASSTRNGSPVSIRTLSGHQIQSNIEIIRGPTSKISSISFEDDEETIKSEGSGSEVELKIQGAVDSNSDDVDSTTDIEIEHDGKEGGLVDESQEELDEDSQVKQSKEDESNFFVRLAILISKAFLFLALVVVLGIFGYYRDMKLKVGYCGVSNDNVGAPSSWSAVPEDFRSKLEPLHPYLNKMDFLLSDHLTPDCAICPDHASCYKNSKMICDNDYTVYYPLKSLFGLIPNEETCAFDKHAEQKRLLLMKYTLNLLRSRQDRPLSLDELRMYLKTTKGNAISDNEFDQYWHNFVNNELVTEPEIVLDMKTKTISIQHKTPINFFTSKPGSGRSRKFLIPTASANAQVHKNDVKT